MKGVVPPMITPFKENGEVDYDGLRVLVNFLKKYVHGLFITGSYGSTALLQTEERKKITEEVIKTVAGAIPVIVHVGTADSYTASELAAHARSCGAAAVSAVGPFYYKHNADSICEFYRCIVKAAGQDMPVYVYNNTKFQGYEMDLKLMKRLKEETGVSGVKDATFDIMAHADYIRQLKDEKFDVASGTEAMWLQSCVLGTEAFIPGLGNAFPELCRKMWEEGMEKKYDECRRTQFTVNEIRDIMYLAKSTQLAVYAMLEVRGILKCYPRSPFIPASPEEKKAIAENLEKLNLLSA
jgi:dihydrodipicolinate synthase/N-acetylneuraminate lyase